MIKSREGKIFYLETTAATIARQRRNVDSAIHALKNKMDNRAINYLRVAEVKLVDVAGRVGNVLSKLELEAKVGVKED